MTRRSSDQKPSSVDVQQIRLPLSDRALPLPTTNSSPKANYGLEPFLAQALRNTLVDEYRHYSKLTRPIQ